MRVFVLILMSMYLFACGKTGALYLPEEPQQPPPQDEQAPINDGSSDRKTD